MKEQLFIIGYPRSGNVWLARLLGRILNSEIASGKPNPSIADEGKERNGKYVIRQSHTQKSVNGKVIFMYRDPRDVAVSAVHYWQYKSLEDMFTSNRKAIRVLSGGTIGGWSNFMNLWLKDYGVDAVVSYEGLHSDAFIELRDALDLIGEEDVPDEVILTAIDEERFSKRRNLIATSHRDKYPYGVNIQLNHMRKGVVGDWQNYFTRETAEMVHEEWWYWLEKLGYEDDEDWWKKVSQ